jgi:adenine-specific DNA-methyltransferase
MQQALKSQSGAARAKIIVTEPLDELHVAMNEPPAALHPAFRGERLLPLTGDLESNAGLRNRDAHDTPPTKNAANTVGKLYHLTSGRTIQADKMGLGTTNRIERPQLAREYRVQGHRVQVVVGRPVHKAGVDKSTLMWILLHKFAKLRCFATTRVTMPKQSPNAGIGKTLRGLVRPRMQRRDVRKGIRAGTRKADVSTRLQLQDAFEFLSTLQPNSVDLIVSSPPYCMGKEYDTSLSVEDFEADHRKLAPLLARALTNGGSLCWQVGHHVRNGVVFPLDAIVYPIFAKQEGLFLRNRIVWTFGHGLHATKRFSGRHETILWFTKGEKYRFDLDAVRVPQKYPGKRYYKGQKLGEWSGNPKGKNPSDVWDIPNVKSRHVEKTSHPCQFPVALVQRLIRALTKRGDLIIDPFMGSGSSAVAAALESRRFSGCDVNQDYILIAKDRLARINRGEPIYRPLDLPIYQPSDRAAVAIRPPHFVAPKKANSHS